MSDTLEFILMAGICLLMNHIPLFHKPFQWMETYFHELSHGLAAIFTIGKIHRIYLKFNGAGLCQTIGGIRIVVLLAGYAGAVLWGMFIYMSGWSLETQQAADFLYALLALQIATIVLWVRDPMTLLVMVTMMATFYTPVYFSDLYDWTPKITQFMGMYITVSALRAPLNLIDGKHEGDGAALADITKLPEGVWIVLWFCFGLFGLFWLWEATVITGPSFLENAPV